MTRHVKQSLLMVVLMVLVSWLAGCGADDSGTAGNNYSGGDYMAHGDDATGGDGSAEASGGSGREDETSPEQKPGQLTAGEWSDLENWTFWQELFGADSEAGFDAHEAAWEMYPHDRFAVRVVAGESAVVDAKVVLMADDEVRWEARTDNRGRAELYDGFFGGTAAEAYTVEVDTGSETKSVAVDGPTGAQRLDIDVQPVSAPAHTLDLMFVVDTTSSMGDELSYIQSELRDVIQSTRDSASESLSIRLSVNFYRDIDDDYVVRPFPFTSDVDQALADLGRQSGGGGGDFPEAVGQALSNAIDEHEWSEEATARLLFLVLDAPPHENPQVIDTLHRITAEAAKKGVRIIPVTGSGVDKPTEFLMRTLGVATGGTYTFLTSDSGIGGEHLEPTIGDYEVEYLNDLLVRVISEYSAQ